MFRMIFPMIKNTILGASLFVLAAFALSLLAKADFGAHAFAQGMTQKDAFRGGD